MSDTGKTRQQLLEELAQLRKTVAALQGAAGASPVATGNKACPKGGRAAVKIGTGEATAPGEALIKRCFDNVPDSVCLTSSDGKILYVNKPAAANLGYSVAELTGKCMGELSPNVSPAVWKKTWAEIKRRGTCLFETRHRRKDGSLYPVEVMATHNVFGGKEYGFFHAQDISSRKLVEQTLAAQKNFYESILETIKDGIMVTNAQDVIVYTNKGMAGIAGIPAPKIVGMNIRSGFSEKTLKNFDPFYRKACKTLQPQQYEAFVVTPANRETWQAGWLLPLALKGRFNGMICTVQDVTSQRQTQDQYRTILKTTQDGFSILDMQGRILDVNDAFCAMTGYRREELLRLRISDIDAVETPREVKDRINKIQKSGHALFETRHRRKDGSIQDVEVSVSCFGAGEGRMVCLTRDITRRKRIENALRQSEAAARTLLNIPSAVMMLLDRNACFIDVNDTMTKRFGRTKQEMRGMCLWDILPPHVAQLRKGYFAQALSRAEMVRWEDERQGMWNDNAFIPVADERGKIVQVIGFAVDITAGKRAEMLLKESEERYRKIFETCAEGILVVDLKTRRFIYANPAMCALLGYSLAGLLRKRPGDIYPKEVFAEAQKHFEDIARGHVVTTRAIPCLHKNGSTVYANISGTKMVFEGREYNVGFFTDVTGRRAIEQKLERSEALFRQTFEHAPIGIVIFDKRGALVNANVFLETIFGYSRDALQAQGLDAHLHAENRQHSIRAMLSAPDKLRNPAVCEKRYVACDGHTAYVKEYAQGVFSATEELVFLIVLIEDITGRTQAEALNINVINKLKDVYNELHDFSAMLPAEQKFTHLVSISDYHLSPMENKVASLIYHSYTNQIIAAKLNISVNTVKHHVTSIFGKFQVRNRMEFLKTIREKRIII